MCSLGFCMYIIKVTKSLCLISSTGMFVSALVPTHALIPGSLLVVVQRAVINESAHWDILTLFGKLQSLLSSSLSSVSFWFLKNISSGFAECVSAEGGERHSEYVKDSPYIFVRLSLSKWVCLLSVIGPCRFPVSRCTRQDTVNMQFGAVFFCRGKRLSL